MGRPSLASRRGRVARIQAKHPRTVVVEPSFQPTPEARERLLDLLVELLDVGGHSGGG